MQKAANFVRGWVEAKIAGPDQEEFMNLCARRGVPFWRVRKLDDTAMTLRVPARSWRSLRTLGGGRWEVGLLRRGGLPGMAWGLRYRWGLLCGMAAAVAVVAVLSQFVLTVQVSGNVKVPTEAILTQLRALGVKPGAFGPGLDTRDVSHRVILAIPELSWMTVNLHGTLADVLVREGNPRPELMEEDVPAHVEARFTGIITHMETTRGMALVEEGDTVVAGDTLISSRVEFKAPEGSAAQYEPLIVRASGRVEARTWHTLKAAIPLEGMAKVPTGEKKTRWSLEILGRRVKFYGKTGIPFEKYDRITTYHTLRLPGGQALPVSLCREECAAYETQAAPIDVEKGEVLLKAALQERLETLVEEGDVVKTDYKTQRQGGLLVVTLLAECRQEIGVTVED